MGVFECVEDFARSLVKFGHSLSIDWDSIVVFEIWMLLIVLVFEVFGRSTTPGLLGWETVVIMLEVLFIRLFQPEPDIFVVGLR
jgi:hypothetical protein